MDSDFEPFIDRVAAGLPKLSFVLVIISLTIYSYIGMVHFANMLLISALNIFNTIINFFSTLPTQILRMIQDVRSSIPFETIFWVVLWTRNIGMTSLCVLSCFPSIWTWMWKELVKKEAENDVLPFMPGFDGVYWHLFMEGLNPYEADGVLQAIQLYIANPIGPRDPLLVFDPTFFPNHLLPQPQPFHPAPCQEAQPSAWFLPPGLSVTTYLETCLQSEDPYRTYVGLQVNNPQPEPPVISQRPSHSPKVASLLASKWEKQHDAPCSYISRPIFNHRSSLVSTPKRTPSHPLPKVTQSLPMITPSIIVTPPFPDTSLPIQLSTNDHDLAPLVQCRKRCNSLEEHTIRKVSFSRPSSPPQNPAPRNSKLKSKISPKLQRPVFSPRISSVCQEPMDVDQPDYPGYNTVTNPISPPQVVVDNETYNVSQVPRTIPASAFYLPQSPPDSQLRTPPAPTLLFQSVDDPFCLSGPQRSWNTADNTSPDWEMGEANEVPSSDSEDVMMETEDSAFIWNALELSGLAECLATLTNDYSMNIDSIDMGQVSDTMREDTEMTYEQDTTLSMVLDEEVTPFTASFNHMTLPATFINHMTPPTGSNNFFASLNSGVDADMMWESTQRMIPLLDRENAPETLNNKFAHPTQSLTTQESVETTPRATYKYPFAIPWTPTSPNMEEPIPHQNESTVNGVQTPPEYQPRNLNETERNETIPSIPLYSCIININPEVVPQEFIPTTFFSNTQGHTSQAQTMPAPQTPTAPLRAPVTPVRPRAGASGSKPIRRRPLSETAKYLKEQKAEEERMDKWMADNPPKQV
ncbi:hypothetical protein TREMEDRAFT_65505 [Tremella mesenterica DSM 1558]|uniref:uncharacterized protein n=1 Tax=Tremella mesenterica (strain ATCC 24925 / CBS 8224 / DSM 1558 / NBRC 9311 / NRRL Y-6157 / RJB 2259-6 / UBC 559-6) TaxID=578456 RepID=UPI00032D1196|nr:uncharacterized protein TREMEDRAFT_65505 [Tremella mesenterica DSM 1558]EIW66637.1 hypothetical protein TREMEDRAFT_65505 [Tremella mesenterica DSM 1558]